MQAQLTRIHVNSMILFALISTCCSGQMLPTPPKPNIKIPVPYADWLKSELQPSPDQDAHPKYAQAEKFFPVYPDNDTFLDPFMDKPWTKGSPKLRSRLLKYAWSISAFTEATQYSRCYLPLEPFGDFADFTVSFQGITNPANALLARAWGKFGHGDEDAVIEAAMLWLRAAEHLAQQPVFGAQMLAANYVQTASDTLLRALHYSNNKPALLKKYGDIIIALASPSLHPANVFVGERIGKYDMCQRMFRWDETLEAIVLNQKGFDIAMTLAGEIHPEAALIQPDDIEFDSTLSLIVEYYDLVDSLLNQPHFKCVGQAHLLATYLKNHRHHKLAPLVTFKAPVIVNVHRAMTRAMGQFYGMQIIWAHMLRLEQGKPSIPFASLPNVGPVAKLFEKVNGLSWQLKTDNNNLRLFLVGFQRMSDDAITLHQDKPIQIWPLKISP